MSDRETTAWHEGGHLAAGIIHGAVVAPEGANIRRGYWQNGEAHVYVPLHANALEDAWWHAVAGEQIDPVLRDAVERQAYVLLGGGLTEAVAEQRSLIAPARRSTIPRPSTARATSPLSTAASRNLPATRPSSTSSCATSQQGRRVCAEGQALRPG